MTIIKFTVAFVGLISLVGLNANIYATSQTEEPAGAETLPGLEEAQQELDASKAAENQVISTVASDSDLQNRFVTGVISGLLGGVVLGGALIWFIKPVEA